MDLVQNDTQTYFLKSVFEESPDAIFIEDLQGKILMANPAAGELHNCVPEELIGKTIYEITDTQDHEEMRNRQHAISNGQIHSFQTIMTLPVGTKVPIDVRMQKIGFGETAAILMMVRINMDRIIREDYLRKINSELESTIHSRTTELQELNLELRRENALRQTAERELASQKNFLQSIIDADPNMVTVKDEDGCFVFVNNAFARFYNKEVSDLIGISNWTLNDDVNEVKQLKEQDSMILKMGHNLEFKDVRIKNRLTGEDRYLHVRKSIIQDSDGRKLIFTFISDLTDITKIQVELKRSNADLEKFAYIASHDLQSPLRTISSYLQLIRKKVIDNGQIEVTQFIDYSIEGARKMQQIIQDLLNYSRIEKIEKKKESVDVNLLFQDVFKNLKFPLESSQAQINLEAMPVILGYRQPLVQLFQNLIDNAIKFVQNKNPIVNISVKASEEDWLFIIKDNGIGISSEYERSIFEIFTRLHSESEYPGTGVGLAICSKVVEMHNGKIWFESKLGEGSTFYVIIPKAL